MMKIGLFYGATTGTTRRVAESIAEAFGEGLQAESIDQIPPEVLESYDVLIFGIATKNIGQLEASWDKYFSGLNKIDFNGKKVALFGTGDQLNYPDTYLDAMGILYNTLVDRGAEMLGTWPTSGYTFIASLGVRQGNFVGLALDDDNQPHLTADRVNDWVAALKEDLGLQPLEIVV